MTDPTATERVDAILAALPAGQRDVLESLRRTISAAAPDAEEAISYGVPAFRYRGRPLVAYSAAKRHLSFFPMGPEVIEAYRAELEGFDTAKGTIRFTPERPLPPDLVTRMVRTRVAAIGAPGG